MDAEHPSRKRVPVSLAELRQRRDAEMSADDRGGALSSPSASCIVFRSKAERHGAAPSTAAPMYLRSNLKRPRTPPETDAGMDARERNAIRKRYMPDEGLLDRHAPRGKPRERTRFKFDWDVEEDTYLSGVEAPLNVAITPEDPYPRRHGTAPAWSRERSMPRNSRERHAMAVSDGVRAGAKREGRHWSEKRADEMTGRDWSIFREDHAISYRGMVLSKDNANADSQNHGSSVQPARNWDEAGLPAKILRLVVHVASYRKPTPIQMAAIPIALGGRDMIGLAETGSGKTAAFVLPMIAHIRQMPPMSHGRHGGNVSSYRESAAGSEDSVSMGHDIASDGPYGLVLAPTRELVLQIEEETRKFAEPLGFRVTAVIGGQGLEEQGMSLQAGSEIVICTPGRMMDLLSRRLAALGNCNYLVLDEADRMVDMGFEAQVQEIIAAIPAHVPEHLVKLQDGVQAFHEYDTNDLQRAKRSPRLRRQTLMFSATMSPAIERIARDYLLQPIVVTIGQTGKAAEAVEQHVEVLSSEGKKRERLVELVAKLDPPIIVFVNTKKGCEDVARLIESRTGIRPVVLHSGKSQEQREEHLEGFRSGRFGVVVATDVLGRGIDIKGVNHVINFELPNTIAPYTHRIGRTGRAGRKGNAWSLATSNDSDLFPDLKAHLEQSGAPVPRLIARHVGAGAASLRPIID
jgi:ATP-dependent RNA helicase DDX23/PRP28